MPDQPRVRASTRFEGTERFRILRELGRGASGTVYEAFDEVRQIRVALKTVTSLDPEVRYRFKREFRALSEVPHEHVVALHELFVDADPWFFTMELVEGTDLTTYVRRADHARLRRAFVELCTGLEALHAQNLLHRDVKPSNVLVGSAGRVVLIDFGIIAEVSHAAGRSGDLTAMVGTPAYMAPEQGLGEAVSSAADWYAVGVMLFEALAGRLPFVGRGMEIMHAKIDADPPRLVTLAPNAPADLAELCDQLLSREPADRPNFARILQLLGAQAVDTAKTAAAQRGDATLFLGREAELSELNAALREVAKGLPVLVRMPGTSGMGKSTLLRHFLAELATHDTALLLHGRCCERESVPFNALDELVDMLAVHLAELPREAQPALTLEQRSALLRLFPVFGQVPGMGVAGRALPANDVESVNSLKVRAHVVEALRVLLRQLAVQRPVVLAIDDAQWGDADSAALLGELMAPPDAPGVLLILAYRRDWEERAPMLMRPEALSRQGRERTVAVDPLPESRARKLAARTLGRDESDAGVFTIVAEARGNAFLIAEFARHVRAVGVPAAGLDLTHILGMRLAELDAAPRQLLEALAVAARPVDPLIAAAALAMTPEAGATALRSLELAGLVHESSRRGGKLRVETFHDRVRETVVAGLAPAVLCERHHGLAKALAKFQPHEVETLYAHYRAAGQNELASEYAARAAQEAATSLAFIRAAELFAAAIELAPEGESRLHAWRVAHADALAHAGRKKDAGDAYVIAASAVASSENEGAYLACTGIQQYLAGGYFDLGMQMAERTLRDIGLPLAKSRNAALLAMVGRLTWLRVRGVGFQEQSETQIPPKKLRQLDACYRVARAISITDPIRGSEMFLRSVLLALEAGEPRRVSWALSCLSTMMTSEGPSAYGARLLALSTALAQKSADPETLAIASMADGTAGLFNGYWRRAGEGLAMADALFQRLGIASSEFYDTRSLLLMVCAFRGQIRELCERVPLAVTDAEQRGDVYIRGILTTSKASLCWLMFDQPELHLELNDSGLTSKHRPAALSIEHVASMVNCVDNDLYTGQPERALERLAATIPLAKASLMLRLTLLSVQVGDALGRAAVMAACQGRDPEKQRRCALREAVALEKRKLPWPTAIATLLRAGEADAAQRAEDAVKLYAQAIERFDAADMALHREVARFRLGQWTEGDEGRQHRERAHAWLTSQGIVAPERVAMMLAPSTRT
jgi:tRNA A-37 threonylcarbamoyl transferase component Bud32